MAADKSTPRPWGMNWAGTDYWVECADTSATIATMETQYNDGEADLAETKANASLIVTAVNQHAALLKCVEALKDAAEYLETISNFPEPGDMISKIESALAAIDQVQDKPDGTVPASVERSALPRREGETT